MTPLKKAAALGIKGRLIVENDTAFLRALYASTRSAEVASTGWPPQIQQSFLAQQFAAQRAHYSAAYPNAEALVLSKAKVDIGRLTLNETEAHFALIDIAFLPHYLGRGFGSAILTDLQTYATKARKPIILHVEQFNPAKRLYTRFGFVTCEMGPVYHRMEWKPENI